MSETNTTEAGWQRRAETYSAWLYEIAAVVGCAMRSSRPVVCYVRDVVEERDRLAAELAAAREREAGLPDDIRAAGWSVAVHNDYRIDGEPHAFWLFTRYGRLATAPSVKGEGRTDAGALNEVREHLGLTGRADAAAPSAPPAGEGLNVADRISDERARELAAEVRKVGEAADAKAKRYVAAVTGNSAPAAGTGEDAG